MGDEVGQFSEVSVNHFDYALLNLTTRSVVTVTPGSFDISRVSPTTALMPGGIQALFKILKSPQPESTLYLRPISCGKTDV